MLDNVRNFKFIFYRILELVLKFRGLKFRDWFGISFFWCTRFCDVKIKKTQNHQIPIYLQHQPWHGIVIILICVVAILVAAPCV